MEAMVDFFGHCESVALTSEEIESEEDGHKFAPDGHVKNFDLMDVIHTIMEYVVSNKNLGNFIHMTLGRKVRWYPRKWKKKVGILIFKSGVFQI